MSLLFDQFFIFCEVICITYNGIFMSRIKLIEVKSDLGGRRVGASLGIDAIHIASYTEQKYFNFFYRFKKHKSLYKRISAGNYLFNEPNVTHKHCKHIEQLIKIYEKLSNEVADGIKKSDFTIVISGDHGTAGGTIAGLKQVNPEQRIGIVWIDAHADIHSPYTSDSGNMHGMPLATAIEDNNLEYKINNLDTESSRLWEKIKSIGYNGPKINPSDLVYVALRDYEPAEAHLINKYKSKIISTQEFRDKNILNIISDILQHLEHCDIIYVSFDVDSMDPSVSVGTGTPVKGGLFASEAEELLCNLLTSTPKIKCLEISEVNPTLDEYNKMAEVAFNILASVCKTIDNNVANNSQIITNNYISISINNKM